MPPTTRSKQAQCRFCLEDDQRINLVAPCICKGSFKYVHPHCLLQWYEHEPVKGLQCSACLTPFARQGRLEFEVLPDLYNLQLFHLDRPYVAILLSHWCFLVWVFYIWPIEPKEHILHVYHVFQAIVHCVYLLRLQTFFSRVKNVELFRKEWFRSSIQLVPFLHVGCLAMMWKTGFLGGIAADCCIVLYCYELFDVCHTINETQTFTFMNRQEEAEQ